MCYYKTDIILSRMVKRTISKKSGYPEINRNN